MKVTRRTGLAALLGLLAGAGGAADAPDWSKGVVPETPECSAASLRESGWMGIPVMPGFVRAEKGGVICNYSIALDIAQVEAWYLVQMGKAGWKASVLGRAETNAITDGPSVRVEYRRADEVVNVIFLYGRKDRETIVMLRRVRYPWEAAQKGKK